MVVTSFKNDVYFQNARDSSFHNFLARPSNVQIYLAEYADLELRMSHGLSE